MTQSTAQAASVLVVEDESAIRNLLTSLLAAEGHATSAAENGREALSRVESGERVDLVVTDIQMPEMNGLELIEILSRRRPDLPVVVVTGHGDRDMLIELIRLGCDDFVQKPIKAGEITSKVAQVLAKKRERERAAHREREQLAERHSALAREAEAYARGVADLRSEIDRAVVAYHDLVQLTPGGYKVDAVWKLQAHRSLGGDYMGIRNTPRGCDVLVADVAGHDLAASYHTVMVKAFFDRNFHTDLDGKTFFRVLNRELHEGGRNERMVTALFMRLDLAGGRGELVCAGHPLVVRLPAGGGPTERLGGHGTVLGVQEEVDFALVRFDLTAGDRLFLCTDGLAAASRTDGPTGVRERLGNSGLERLYALHADKPLAGQVEAVWDGVMEFCRYKQSDDMLLLGIEIPPEARPIN